MTDIEIVEKEYAELQEIFKDWTSISSAEEFDSKIRHTNITQMNACQYDGDFCYCDFDYKHLSTTISYTEEGGFTLSDVASLYDDGGNWHGDFELTNGKATLVTY